MIKTAIRVVFVACTVVLLSAPVAAYGSTAHLVERHVETVSGADIALDALAGLRGVELGSHGATITLAADGFDRTVPVRFGMPGDPSGDPYAGVALLAFAGSVVARIAAVLSRLLG
jgi:hypothetical protein